MNQNVWLQQVLIDQKVNRKSFLESIRQRLITFSDTPYLDAQVLLSEVLQKPRSWILSHPNPELRENQGEQINQMVHDIRQGVPLPYVIGHWEFYKLDFKLSSDVLIPRPETEFIVEKAADWLTHHPTRRWAADIGTGSGCIAISLASLHPDLKMIACDISCQALSTALDNAQIHQVGDQISFIQMDLLAGLKTRFDLIVANLPYIPTSKLEQLAVFHQEPRIALDGGSGGLDHLERFLSLASTTISPDGLICLEIDEDSGQESLALANAFFPAAAISLEKDFSGSDRYLIIHNGTK